MGYIAIRGTRTKPKRYVQFKDADGKYKMRAVKGACTKEDARKVLAQIEARVAAGKRGFVDTPTNRGVTPLALRMASTRTRAAPTVSEMVTCSSKVPPR